MLCLVDSLFCIRLRKMRKPLSRSQAVCLILLWVALCFIVLTSAARIDGPLVVSLALSAVLVLIPVWKSFRH